ncbi:MAG: hypothetical protein BIFFINMI_03165 [Phycisphaerae bacterium]|nr:hypothetical protein [Phycisphaerae bacterium]
MTMESEQAQPVRTQPVAAGAGQGAPTAGEIVERLMRFTGPPQDFLVSLLQTQCLLGPAAGGAILRVSADQSEEGRPAQSRLGLLCVWPQLPQDRTIPAWLARAVELGPEVVQSGSARTAPLLRGDELYGQQAARHIVLLPIRGAGQTRGAEAFLIDRSEPAAVSVACERLEMTLPLLSLYEMRLATQTRQADMAHMRTAMETLAAVGEHDRFRAAAMTFCNELASRWDADRVSIGFLRGRYVQLRATSHTEKFSRRMELIQSVESAMEECLDQDLEVIHPPPPQSSCVGRMTAELAGRFGPSAVLSLPLRREGEVVGVVTAERPLDRPWDAADIEAMRLTCDLCTPWLLRLHRTDRWFGARWADAAGRGLGVLIGPKHTWAKLTAMAICGLIVFSILARGDHEVKSPYVLQPMQKRIITAPYDAPLKELGEGIEPGAHVKDGQLLAVLDVSTLVSQREAAQAEVDRYLKQADTALAAKKVAEQQAQLAQADGARAKVRLLDEQISRAKIAAPIDGQVLWGDWTQTVGRPLHTGDKLFEIGPTALLAELNVPERDIVDVQEHQHGRLVNPSDPDKTVGFEVVHISPVAEVVGGDNVFKVRVRLDEQPDWMKPGLEGSARIHLGRDRYATLWTRPLIRWVRMKLWW